MSQRYLSDLNDEQKAAVTSPINEPLFIYAGAGSGKTRTLICRVAFMIDSGVKPENILAMTFTRKAADEIRDRIKNFIGPKAAAVTTCTFHQLCLNILRQNPFILGFSGQDTTFHIADNNEQRKIIKNAAKALHAKHPDRKDISSPNQLRILANKMLSFVNKAKMIGKKSGDMSGDFFFFLKFYEDQMKKKRMIDFTDFLTYTKELFLKHQIVALHYRKQYTHILIDEFQDTSDLNFAVLKLLLHQSMSNEPPNRCVTIVGDPHQSIYSFRGANPNNINQFIKLFPDARRVTLSTNYRSTESIVSASQSLIRYDTNKDLDLDMKKLSAINHGGIVPKLICASDAYSEAEQICTEIERLVYPGSQYQYRDIVVMFRMKKVSAELEMELFRRNIPYTNKRGISFYMRTEVKEIMSYGRLLLAYGLDESDPNGLLASSFEMILNVPDRGIRQNVATMIKDKAAQKGINVLQCLQEVINGKSDLNIPKATVAKLKDFDNLISKLHRQVCVINKTMATNTILELILDITKIYDLDSDGNIAQPPPDEKKDDEIDDFNDAIQDIITDRAETIQLLLEEAKRFHMMLMQKSGDSQLVSESTLRKFITSISLETNTGFVKNAVTLSTIHQMKGLESPICFLLRFNQGILPMADNDSKDDSGLGDSTVSLQEERRIAYVAMTRAKHRLFITCALSARGRTCEPSEFINEIESKYISRDIALSEQEKAEVEKAIALIDDSDETSDFEFDFDKSKNSTQAIAQPQ